MQIIHISHGGPDHKIIDATGKEWLFEMHPYCGPIALKKDGDSRKKQPSEKSPFWTAVTDWAQQGQKINADNYCEYNSLESETVDRDWVMKNDKEYAHTWDWDEHPRDYDEWCWCALCRSYM